MANPPSTSPLEDISDVLYSLPLKICVQLTRRLLASISSFRKGAARARAVLKPLSSSSLNMAARPRTTNRGKILRLAYWNAADMRGRMLQLEHFLGQHAVDICLLSETFLTPAKPSGLPIMSATAQTGQQLGVARPSWSGVKYNTTRYLSITSPSWRQPP